MLVLIGALIIIVGHQAFDLKGGNRLGKMISLDTA
jgi:hypothetical protein